MIINFKSWHLGLGWIDPDSLQSLSLSHTSNLTNPKSSSWKSHTNIDIWVEKYLTFSIFWNSWYTSAERWCIEFGLRNKKRLSEEYIYDIFCRWKLKKEKSFRKYDIWYRGHLSIFWRPPLHISIRGRPCPHQNSKSSSYSSSSLYFPSS